MRSGYDPHVGGTLAGLGSSSVDVRARRQVAALDQVDVVRREVVPRPAVARRGGDDARPVVAAEAARGAPARRRTPPARGRRVPARRRRAPGPRRRRRRRGGRPARRARQSWSVRASASSPARSEAPIPSAQSSARMRETDIGSSADARRASAPSTTTISCARPQRLDRRAAATRCRRRRGPAPWVRRTGGPRRRRAAVRRSWPHRRAHGVVLASPLSPRRETPRCRAPGAPGWSPR